MGAVLQSPRITVPEDAFGAYEQLCQLGVTDGLPVIPPLEELVVGFVDASSRTADQVVAKVPPLNGAATVEKIAINAVMAGCRPEYMPLLIATVEAACEPTFNLHGIQTTTNPVSPMIIVNGPIRQQLEINCGRGILGPGHRANATIGRALRLIMLNVGGAIPGEVDKAIHGQPGKYTMCFGELEEESPWNPLHVERGLCKEQSSVTVVGTQATHNLCPTWKKAENIFRGIANGMAAYATNNFMQGRGNPVLILNPGHATLLAEQGYSKQQVKEQLYERSRIRLSDWPAEPGAQMETAPRHIVGEWMYATASPGDIIIVVAGGPEAYHVTYCPNFGETQAATRLVI